MVARGEAYDELARMVKDLEQMFRNARKYNIKGSQVFADALALQQTMRHALLKVSPQSPFDLPALPHEFGERFDEDQCSAACRASTVKTGARSGGFAASQPRRPHRDAQALSGGPAAPWEKTADGRWGAGRGSQACREAN